MESLPLERLFDTIPQLAIVLVVLGGFFFLLREHRHIRRDIRDEVRLGIDATLGSNVAEMKQQALQAKEAMESLSEYRDEMVGNAKEAMSRIKQLEKDIAEKAEIAEQKYAQISNTISASEALSARDKIQIAKFQANPGTALSLLREILEDSDATSQDLELAGDRARLMGKLELAMDLYLASTAKDPENASARIEYLVLTAKLKPSERDKALKEAMDLVVDTMGRSGLVTTANTLISLKRWEDQRDLCRRVLECGHEPQSDVYVQANRDLAVAHEKLGELDQAEKYFKRAFEGNPSNENVVKGYAVFLANRHDYRRALELAKRLPLLDPVDVDHYLLVGDYYVHLENDDKAIEWFKMAGEVAKGDAEAHNAKDRLDKAERRKLLRGVVESSVDQH